MQKKFGIFFYNYKTSFLRKTKKKLETNNFKQIWRKHKPKKNLFCYYVNFSNTSKVY